MPKPFNKLRAKIMEAGMQQSDLEHKLNKSHSYISFRMCGRKPWTLEEVYEISDILEIPNKDILGYFPPYKQV